jgi:hypothetical protein
MARRALKDQFPQEWKGDHSAVHTAGTHVARTQDEWEKLWAMTFANQFPAPKAPKLPEGKMAIGVFTGQSSKPSELSMASEQKGDKTTVRWTAESYDSMLCVMHEPYLLAFIPATKDVEFVDAASKPKTPKPGRKGPGLG